MYSINVEYEDFNGVKKEKTLYFYMSKTELVKASLNENNQLEEKLMSMAKEKNMKAMGKLFEDIVGLSYGIKSEDGDNFYKDEKIRYEFEHSAVYDALFMKLLESTETAIAFIKGIIPQGAADNIDFESNPKYKELMESMNK